jgi:hypothetical protein
MIPLAYIVTAFYMTWTLDVNRTFLYDNTLLRISLILIHVTTNFTTDNSTSYST